MSHRIQAAGTEAASPVKGAGRCPTCASRKVIRREIPIEVSDGFYAREVEICVNCKTAWEPFDPAQIWDASDPHCSFSEPCNNCAFRPGSPEQQDTEQWKKLMASLKEGGQFFCHKGVPIDPASKDGFAYPRDKSGNVNRQKMRLCRGYLNTLGKRFGIEQQKGNV